MLITTSGLIEKSFSLVHKHMRVFAPYVLALIAPVFIYLIILQLFAVSNTAMFRIFEVFFSIVIGILQLWVTLGLTKEIAERYAGNPVMTWKQQLHFTIPMIIPAVVISILTTIIVFAGTLFFIIPGIIFSVWYLFGSIALVLENKRGMEALRMSKSLVKGRWWHVFLSSIIPTLLVSLAIVFFDGLLGFVFNLFAPEMLVEFISATVTFIFVPFFLAIYTILYIELRRNPLQAPVAPAPTAPTPPPSF